MDALKRQRGVLKKVNGVIERVKGVLKRVGHILTRLRCVLIRIKSVFRQSKANILQKISDTYTLMSICMAINHYPLPISRKYYLKPIRIKVDHHK